MKRLMIPIGAGALALAGTVALALGPNSNADWGVHGTAGGVLSVQGAPAVAGNQRASGTARPNVLAEPRTEVTEAEATTATEPTAEPRRTNTPEPTKEPTSTPATAPVDPKGTSTVQATPAPALEPAQPEPTKEVPAATNPVGLRAANDQPAKPAEVHPSAGQQKVEESSGDKPATKTKAMNADRAP